MQYYGLKSIVGSHKQPVPLKSELPSFSVWQNPVDPYIEPTFSKIEYPTEGPSILLVSAVGASGKTTTARALSFDTKLPLLDLAKHKAVGDNTLTGILTMAYPIEHVGTVLQGLQEGTHGIIIDGIDEGRSKTTEEGFEAFLDDLVERSKSAKNTVVVLFGRSQVLLTTWCYLMDKGVDVGLISIDPFGLDEAKAYIDRVASDIKDAHRLEYENARDSILAGLGAAFSSSVADRENAFLSFIGYPPVLDAIGTLLSEETNYYRLQQKLGKAVDGSVEISLLVRICDYLMAREHDEKAVPNFIEAVTSHAESSNREQLCQSLYSREEQCARVLHRALGSPFAHQLIEDHAMNESYEAAVGTWCQEHPFLNNDDLRNAVFEAAAVSYCILSDVPDYKEVAIRYTEYRRPTYHLLYIMDVLARNRSVDIRGFNMLMQSCSEFLATTAEISVDIEGESWEDTGAEVETVGELTMTIKFPEKGQERTFTFLGESTDVATITLGPYLVNASVTLPCHINLLGRPALESIGESYISARRVSFDATDVIVRALSRQKDKDQKNGIRLFFDVERADGHADAVSLGGASIQIQCCAHNLGYPLAKYVHRRAEQTPEPVVREKYRRLRRILLDFRSHSRGGLAKYRQKIENRRVLKNKVGEAVLEALLNEGILRSDPKFYYVESEQMASKLGITWHGLLQYELTKKLETFLQRVR